MLGAWPWYAFCAVVSPGVVALAAERHETAGVIFGTVWGFLAAILTVAARRQLRRERRQRATQLIPRA